MTCCGQERGSRFCPECGKRLRDGDGLEGLLAHCRICANRARTFSANMATCPGKDEPSVIRNRISQDGHAAKWDAWAEQLDALLKATDGTPINERQP